MANSAAIAERCNVELDFSEYRFPGFPVPEGSSPDAYLADLCEYRLSEKYRPVTEEIRHRLQEELALIRKLGLSGYFLCVWDIVQFARRQGVPV